ncbi:MAG: aminotransferase class III-fold pyridoxal phosphate-dependent enzyme [Candidatus Sulfotelmatobacter sp.]
MVREFVHASAPYCYRCSYSCRNCGAQYAAEVERAIEQSDEETAAFIFEPVSGATLGAVVPPKGYVQKIAEICKRHGVLLIADEVMTGMGRFTLEECTTDERGRAVHYQCLANQIERQENVANPKPN